MTSRVRLLIRIWASNTNISCFLTNLKMMQASTKASYIFPTLKPQEILQCMNNLQIPFTDEDLSKPTPTRMQAVYEGFTDNLMGVTREQYEMPGYQVLEEYEYPVSF